MGLIVLFPRDSGVETGVDPRMPMNSLEISLPAGKARDGAVEHLVGSFAESDPEAAVLWGETIGDAVQRSVALTTVVEQ